VRCPPPDRAEGRSLVPVPSAVTARSRCAAVHGSRPRSRSVGTWAHPRAVARTTRSPRPRRPCAGDGRPPLHLASRHRPQRQRARERPDRHPRAIGAERGRARVPRVRQAEDALAVGHQAFGGEQRHCEGAGPPVRWRLSRGSAVPPRPIRPALEDQAPCTSGHVPGTHRFGCVLTVSSW